MFALLLVAKQVCFDGYVDSRPRPCESFKLDASTELCDYQQSHKPVIHLSRDAETITELSSGTAAEVELVSLLEEQLPQYRLRADKLTEFGGYDNSDFYINAPLLPSDAAAHLSNELIEETLNYFILCAERLAQMTRTYDDTEALTRLLEEKERDLELAAYIGKGLLEDKRSLEERIEFLEQEVQTYQDTVTQLKHEISLKNSLLRVYTEGSVETPGDDEEEEDGRQRGKDNEVSTHVEALRRKMADLEAENARLRQESELHESDLASLEIRETDLVADCVRELNEARKHATSLQEELKQRTEYSVKHQEEMTGALTQLVDTQRRVRELAIENETLRLQLDTTAKGETELAKELMDTKEAYASLLDAYKQANAAVEEMRKQLRHELQDDMRRIQKHSHASKWPYGSYTKYIHPDSLASELSSAANGASSEGYVSADEQSQSQKTLVPTVGRVRDHDTHSGRSKLTSVFTDLDEESSIECRTPDSELGSFASRFSGSIIKRYRLPDKVKLVKPLEGSVTLKQWRKLANPTLFGELVQEHKKPEGIKTRSIATAPKSPPPAPAPDPLEQPFVFLPPSTAANPGRNINDTSCIYTFSTSTVMHPTTVTCSALGVQMSTGVQVPHVPPTSSGERSLPYRTTSTCSTSHGLAVLLRERGIHAALPTVLREKMEGSSSGHRSAPMTPVPSVEGSPDCGTPIESSILSSAFDVDGLIGKLSRLIGGFVSTTPVTTRTSDTRPSLCDISATTNVSASSPSKHNTSIPAVKSPSVTGVTMSYMSQSGCGRGPTSGLVPMMRMPLNRTPNPMVQLNSMSTTLRPRSLTPDKATRHDLTSTPLPRPASSTGFQCGDLSTSGCIDEISDSSTVAPSSVDLNNSSMDLNDIIGIVDKPSGVILRSGVVGKGDVSSTLGKGTSSSGAVSGFSALGLDGVGIVGRCQISDDTLPPG